MAGFRSTTHHDAAYCRIGSGPLQSRNPPPCCTPPNTNRIFEKTVFANNNRAPPDLVNSRVITAGKQKTPRLLTCAVAPAPHGPCSKGQVRPAIHLLQACLTARAHPDRLTIGQLSQLEIPDEPLPQGRTTQGRRLRKNPRPRCSRAAGNRAIGPRASTSGASTVAVHANRPAADPQPNADPIPAVPPVGGTNRRRKPAAIARRSGTSGQSPKGQTQGHARVHRR